MTPDLELAIQLADVADAVSLDYWNPDGVTSTLKLDGSPVTDADVAVEEAVLRAVSEACPEDDFVGEEVGERVGSGASGRRWIVDGIDGTNFFADGLATWGTLIALEAGGDVVVGVLSSPAQGRRWWASRRVVAGLARGTPRNRQWHHAIQVAEGALDVSIWFCGDLWDHAAPSILVEEAGGQFSDHWGRRRLDTRTAIYSNGANHVQVLAAFSDS